MHGFERALLPKDREIIRGWDLAASKKDRAAWTAGVKISRDREGNFYIEDVHRLRETPGQVERAIRSTAEQDGINVEISIPQDPGQAGKAQVRYYAKQLVGFEVRFSPESGDKETRAGPLSALAEAGNVYMVRALWNEEFLNEATVFPNSEFKDQVDAASRAFARLIAKKKRRVAGTPEVHSVG